MNQTKAFVFVLVLGLTFGVVLFNSFLQTQLNVGLANLQSQSGFTTNTTANNSIQASLPNAVDQEALLAEIIPNGIPPIYGQEMGISFDAPEEAIVALSKYDGGWTNHKNAIFASELSAEQLERYVKIGSSISCEFCCGAQTLVTKEGEAACGCAHSAAMRGLAKYLLKNHPDEFSDEQILEELTKVKVLSFPKQMVERALNLQASGQPINSVTQNLPSQVGGC